MDIEVSQCGVLGLCLYFMYLRQICTKANYLHFAALCWGIGGLLETVAAG